MIPARLQVALGALALAAAGLVTLAVAFSGESTFASLAAPRGAVIYVGAETRLLDPAALRAVHRETIAYILGDAAALPLVPGGAAPLFDADERAHMADVRRVFSGALALRWAGVAGVVLLVALWARGGVTVLARRLRAAAIAATVGVALVAVVAAVAFEPLFTVFHEIVFPQGN